MSVILPFNAGDTSCTAPGSVPSITASAPGLSGRVLQNYLNDIGTNGLPFVVSGKITKSGSAVATVDWGSPIPYSNGQSIYVYVNPSAGDAANFPSGTYTLSTIGGQPNKFTYNDGVSLTGSNTSSHIIIPNVSILGLRSLFYQVAAGVVQELNADQGAWTNFSFPSQFGSNIGIYGSPYSTPAYRKDALGMVHVKAQLSVSANVANLSTLLQLPAGFRPVEVVQGIPCKWGRAANNGTWWTTFIGDVPGVIGVNNTANGGQIITLQPLAIGDNLGLLFSFLGET